MRKFKITSNRSDTVTYVSTQDALERSLVYLARRSHPRMPVTILVQDLTPIDVRTGTAENVDPTPK